MMLEHSIIIISILILFPFFAH